MKGLRTLLVGYDITDDYFQITCYNQNTFQPEIIYYDYDNTNELLPTIMALKNETKEWMFSFDAIKAISKNEAYPVIHLLDAVKKGKKITIMEENYDAVDVLSIFFRKSLSLIKRYYPDNSILKLVVTIDETDIKLVNGIFAALDKLDLHKDRVSVQSHAQSFIYYVLNQKKELWMNDVCLFHFDNGGLKYYQINMNRKHRPITVGAYTKNYSDVLKYGQSMDHMEKGKEGVILSETRKLPADIKKMAKNQAVANEDKKNQISLNFENIVSGALYKQIISTIYITGTGFEGSWADEILKKLCFGKRLFKGWNLFSEGACYAAREFSGTQRLGEYIVMSDEMVNCSISLQVYHSAKDREMVLVRTATPWYEAEKNLELILDNTNEIEVVVRNELKNTKKSYFMALDILESRPNKTTRVRIKLRFIDANTCIVNVKDLGFGDLYPSTNRIWEKVLNL